MSPKHKQQQKKKSAKPVAKLAKQMAKAHVSPTVLGSALRSLGGLAGGLVGSSTIGSSMGGELSKWLGSGDYDLESNSIVEKFQSSGQIPAMHKNGQSIIVRHKEYVCDISSSATGPPSVFNVYNTYPLNPGIATTFPWLSGIAQQYQEYTFKGLVFHYRATSGESVAATNTSLGTVMLATQYRSTAPAFTSKTQLLNEYFSSDGKPSEDFCHPIECDPKENPFNVQYVRGGAVPTGEDVKTYDLGILTAATEGMPNGSGTDVGELWVSYEVELRKPILSSLLQSFSNFWSGHTATGVAAAHPLGTSSSWTGIAIASTFQPTFTTAGLTITFPLGMVGAFFISIAWSNCTAFVVPAISMTAGTGSITSSFYIGGAYAQFASTAYSVGTGAATTAFSVLIPDANIAGVINFGTGGTMTGVTDCDLHIAQVNDAFN